MARSRIPKGSTVEDWPFGLEELEPYYDRVEREIGVSGKAGNVNGRIDRGGNIFEGARAREYPMPPLRGSGFTEMMATAARGSGWHAFPGPAAINSRSYQNRTACVYHGFCARGGCHVNAKGSTAVTTIPKAVSTKRLSVVTEAHVIRVDVNDAGRVDGRLVSQGRDRVPFNRPTSSCSRATRTRTCGCCSCRNRSRSRMGCRTIADRSDVTTSATTPAVRSARCSRDR